MENTAFNGTVTKDHEDWKKKKGYGPIIVAASLALLLGLSVYSTGGPVDGGTTLPPPLYRDEKEMPKGAAFSSSLVGSGIAASDMKTLTIVLEDDVTIDGVLSGWPRTEQRLGGSSAYCQKNTGYNCGAVFPPDSNTCNQKGCCCHQEDGGGFKMNACDSATGYANRGCNSCWGPNACMKTNNVNIGASSCHVKRSCQEVSESTVGNDSCRGPYSCYEMQNSIIGKGSCRSTDGYSCSGSENVQIGNNSCNGGSVCKECKHNVPDNACIKGITDDIDINGYCNYCL